MRPRQEDDEEEEGGAVRLRGARRGGLATEPARKFGEHGPRAGPRLGARSVTIPSLIHSDFQGVTCWPRRQPDARKAQHRTARRVKMPGAAALWGLALLGVACCSAFETAAPARRHHFRRTPLADPARRCAVADAAWRRSTLLRATIEDVATDESARLQRARGRLADAMAGDMFMSPIEKAERGLAPPAPAPAAPPKKAPRFAGPESRTRPQLPPSTTGGRSSVAQPLVGYDPEASAALLWRQPLRWIKRNVEIVLPFVGFATSLLVDVAQSQEEARRAVRAKELLGIISKLGPAIIKGGQALASRPDLLPAEYVIVPPLPLPCRSPTAAAPLLLRHHSTTRTTAHPPPSPSPTGTW